MAAGALTLLLVGGWVFGREVNAGQLTIGGCIDLGAACIGERLETSYVPVSSVTGGVVEVRHRGHLLRLHGVAPAGVRPGIDEVSVIATWSGGGDLQVHDAIHHPHRRLKRLAGVIGLLGWLVYLGRRRPRG